MSKQGTESPSAGAKPRTYAVIGKRKFETVRSAPDAPSMFKTVSIARAYWRERARVSTGRERRGALEAVRLLSYREDEEA